MADRNEYLDGPMWYVVHTYSGYEKKVKDNIEKSIQNLHLEDQILEVRFPVEEVIQIKASRRKRVTKKLFPGYVLVHMIMNEETWYVVRNTRGVTGFVGPESKPVPLTEEEMMPFFYSDGGEEEKMPEDELPIEVDIEIGDRVAVKEGIWAENEGTVVDIDLVDETVKVTVDGLLGEQEIELGLLDVVKK